MVVFPLNYGPFTIPSSHSRMDTGLMVTLTSPLGVNVESFLFNECPPLPDP